MHLIDVIVTPLNFALRLRDGVKPGSDVIRCDRQACTSTAVLGWNENKRNSNLRCYWYNFLRKKSFELSRCFGRVSRRAWLLNGLCAITATSLCFCCVFAFVDVCLVCLPANKSQTRQTGEWLWKLFVTEYTKSTRTWTQHWTCSVAMTGCVITDAVTVRCRFFISSRSLSNGAWFF